MRALLPALEANGWILSRLRRQSVDATGQPLPWMAYAAIDFLSERVSPGMRVFEFGSGNSTLWWASRVSEVLAVEHDEGWAQRVAERLPPNAEVTHAALEPGDDYVEKAARSGHSFNVVVVDGRHRVRSALASVGCLAEDGVIVWDNSERTRYERGLDALARQGFRRIRFTGLAPIGTAMTETSILYRRHNCLGI